METQYLVSGGIGKESRIANERLVVERHYRLLQAGGNLQIPRARRACSWRLRRGDAWTDRSPARQPRSERRAARTASPHVDAAPPRLDAQDDGALAGPRSVRD